MKAENIVRSTLSGIAKAQRSYEAWSGGFWLWEAPEYVATTMIAEALHKLDDVEYVTLEYSVTAAISHAGGKRGRPNKLLKGRFDITVWDDQAEPRGLIEVKTKAWRFNNLQKDIDRLCTTLRKTKSIKFGLIAYFLSAKTNKKALAKDQVKRMSDVIFQEAESHFNAIGMTAVQHQSSVRRDGDSAWTVEVLEIVRDR